jgi:glycogen phosphorylase
MPRPNTLDHLNCGPVELSGSSDALYERHLTFDQVIPVAAATPRNKFEAVARSLRDLRCRNDGSQPSRHTRRGM